MRLVAGCGFVNLILLIVLFCCLMWLICGFGVCCLGFWVAFPGLL